MSNKNNTKIVSVDIGAGNTLRIWFPFNVQVEPTKLVEIYPDLQCVFCWGRLSVTQISKAMRMAKDWKKGELYWKKEWIPYYINKD